MNKSSSTCRWVFKDRTATSKGSVYYKLHPQVKPLRIMSMQATRLFHNNPFNSAVATSNSTADNININFICKFIKVKIAQVKN